MTAYIIAGVVSAAIAGCGIGYAWGYAASRVDRLPVEAERDALRASLERIRGGVDFDKYEPKGGGK